MDSYLQGTAVLGSTITVVAVPPAGQTYNNDHDTVLAVQTKLKALGFDPGPLDGLFGTKTSAAIRKMQASIGQAQTGVIDSGVLIALKVSAPEKPLYQPSAPAPPPSPPMPLTAPNWVQQPPPHPSLAPAPPVGFWSEPAWEGTKVKRWHVGVGVAGGLALVAGVILVRR